MLKSIVILIAFMFSCGDDNKQDVTDDDTGGKTKNDKEVKLELAVIGDSLATGFFSDIGMGETISEANALQHSIIKESLTMPNLGKLPRTYELDKAMKQKYENPFTCAENEEQSECSFSYQKKAGFTYDKVKNAAVSGAVVSSLMTQLNQIAKLGNAKTYIVQVGGNDFCASDFKPEDYKNDMQKVIDKILGANASAQIIVTAIPDLVKLYKEVATAEQTALTVNQINNPLIVQRLGNKTELTFLCKHIRDGKKIDPAAPDVPVFCPRISKHIPADDSDKPAFFATKTQELNATNKAIADLLAGYSNTSIKFAASIAELTFIKQDISADCVHPSRAGQKKLADALWQYKF